MGNWLGTFARTWFGRWLGPTETGPPPEHVWSPVARPDESDFTTLLIESRTESE